PVFFLSLGDSFTVHNDKEFETKVLKANYRHANFSSFQRQLNMYGFRKVADCSDRTYSHPFFRRNQPNLLSEVRRVVSMTAAAAAAAAAAATMNASEIAASMSSGNGSGNKRQARAGEDDDEYGSHTTGESDGGDNDNINISNGGGDGSSCPPARKKLRVCVGGVSPSSSSSPAAAARSPVVHLQHLNNAGVGDGKGRAVYGGVVGGGGVFSQQLNFGCIAPLPGPTVAHKLRLQASAATANAHASANASAYANAHAHASGSSGSVPKQEFPSLWHQHTGLWGGVSTTTNSCVEDPWTSGSGSGSGSGSSSSSAASSVEASSPVLLPINPADLDCSSNIPPFYLQSETPPPPPPHLHTHHQQQQQQQPIIGELHRNTPALVSPAGSSAVAEGVRFGAGPGEWRGGARNAYPGFARSVSPAEEEEEVAAVAAAAVYSRGLYSDAWSLGDDGGAGVGFAADQVGGGRGAGKGEDGPLSLDKAFGFGAALARCPSFDLIIDSDDLAVADVPVSPAASMSSSDEAKNASAAAAAAAASPFGPREAPTIINRSVGWDLASLGGPGWGSPDTHHSAATEPWAALPPLGA
ncbi:unnamed protein product, partial [Laminaria digitata]